MPLHAHGAVGGGDAAFQVVAEGEGFIFEARTRQGRARGDRRVEARFDHEEVVVARVAVDVSGLALDEIPDHVVGHTGADTAERLPVAHDGVVKHQRDFVVETRSRRPQRLGEWVGVGAVQERATQPGGDGFLWQILLADVLRRSRGEHPPFRVDDEEFGTIRGEQAFLAQGFGIERLVEPASVGLGEVGEVFPLRPRPVFEQAHAGGGDALESALDRRIAVAVEPAGPAHGELAGFAEPGQPVPLGGGERHAPALERAVRARRGITCTKRVRMGQGLCRHGAFSASRVSAAKSAQTTKVPASPWAVAERVRTQVPSGTER